MKGKKELEQVAYLYLMHILRNRNKEDKSNKEQICNKK